MAAKESTDDEHELGVDVVGLRATRRGLVRRAAAPRALHAPQALHASGAPIARPTLSAPTGSRRGGCTSTRGPNLGRDLDEARGLAVDRGDGAGLPHWVGRAKDRVGSSRRAGIGKHFVVARREDGSATDLALDLLVAGESPSAEANAARCQQRVNSQL